MKRYLGILFAACLAAAVPAAAKAQSGVTYQLTDSGGVVHQVHGFQCLGGQLCLSYVPGDFNGAAFGVSANPFYVAPGAGFTFPISAVALPLAPNAAQEAGGNLAAIVTNQGAPGSGITPPTGGSGVLGFLSGIYNKLTGSIAVTGTFFQATQPVSATALPLPTGAATQSTLASILSALGSPFQAGGSIANTSFGISGSLPGFAAPPTVLSFAANSKASISRSANTTTYTANTGWNNGTPAFFSFTAACRVNGGQVLIPRIDIWSSANPTTKLTGLLWLFAGVPGTNVVDNATFTIASGDFASLTGNFGGIPFTLGNSQASGAANSGVSLTGTTLAAQCPSGSTTITGMVEVTNAYVPASGEVLNVSLSTVGVN